MTRSRSRSLHAWELVAGWAEHGKAAAVMFFCCIASGRAADPDVMNECDAALVYYYSILSPSLLHGLAQNTCSPHACLRFALMDSGIVWLSNPFLSTTTDMVF